MDDLQPTTAKIAASKKSSWAKLTAQFPNADKSQFFAQVYSDGKGNITGYEMFLKGGHSVFGSDRKYWTPQMKAALGLQGVEGFPYQLSPLRTKKALPIPAVDFPTPDMAKSFPHLMDIAHEIPPLDKSAKVQLLIGRDAPELLKVREFRNGPRGAPWAQRVALGWTISSQMCLDFPSGPAHVLTRLSTDTERNQETGDKSYELVPCPNQFKVEDPILERATDSIFKTTRGDNEPSLFCDDRAFLEIIETGIHKNESGNWEMPLPFRDKLQTMPNNRGQAMQRLQGLLKTSTRKPEMRADYLKFMGKIIEKSHASQLPSDEAPSPPGPSWYLPHFETYHNTKHTIRVVFDSSCEFQGVSLNKVLLPGPDLMNNLIGVLMRFGKENIAIMCNVKQMFQSFYVDPAQRLPSFSVV